MWLPGVRRPETRNWVQQGLNPVLPAEACCFDVFLDLIVGLGLGCVSKALHNYQAPAK